MVRKFPFTKNANFSVSSTGNNVGILLEPLTYTACTTTDRRCYTDWLIWCVDLHTLQYCDERGFLVPKPESSADLEAENDASTLVSDRKSTKADQIE